MNPSSGVLPNEDGRSVRLRLRVAVNLFKQLLLGARHEPGIHQTTEVFNALADGQIELKLTDSTWKSWVAGDEVAAQPTKVQSLDNAFVSTSKRVARESADDSRAFPKGFITSLVKDGLVHRLLAPTGSKFLLKTLVGRAATYRPVSPLHLHFDAIDACNQVDGLGDIPWTDIKEIAANRILQLVDERWRRRDGTVYQQLQSDLRLRWNSTDEIGRQKIRQTCARFKPDRFNAFMNAGASPIWRLTGIETDASWAHAHKTLFAIAADDNFLVADRLDAWALDLATSSLAMFALAWANRFETFSHRVTIELIWWRALKHLFFKNTNRDDLADLLYPAMAHCKAVWRKQSIDSILLARTAYHSRTTNLGVTPDDIFRVAMVATKVHPLILKA